MPRLEIVDAKPFHVGALIRAMRVDHQAALMHMGVPVHREFRAMFDGSYYAKSAFLDGKLAAIWGCEGSPLGSDGLVWLALAQHAMKHPVTIMRQARKELEYLGRTKTHLATTVIWGDEPAIRLAIALGFRARDGSIEGARAESRAGRTRLFRYLTSTPELMVPAGGSQQIGIVWEAA